MNLYQIMQEYKKVSGVYCITNPNGNIYIGSAVDLKRRMQQYKRLDCKNQRLLNQIEKENYQVRVNRRFQNHLKDFIRKKFNEPLSNSTTVSLPYR